MPELPPPTLRREGDDLIFTWEQAGAQVLVRDLAIGRDGPRAEVWARHFPDVHLHVGMLNLLSTTSKANFIRAVSDRDGATDWADAIEQVGVLATEFHRAGEPLELLEPRRRPEAGQYAIEPLAPLGQPTLWYGDGKSLKSYALLAGCRAMSRGESLAGMQTTHLKPAILDFEWDKTEHDDRLLRLGGDADIYYRHCTGSLHEQVRSLRREFDRVNVDFLGIDSLGLACGGDPSNPEIALRFFSALRALERTAVVIHHTPNEAKKPFGSAYIRNSARAGWFFARSASIAGDRSVTVALGHKWTNTGRLSRPIGLRFAFDEDMYSTDVSRADADAKGILLLEGAAGPKDAMLAFLETTPGAELQEIAQAIAEEPSKVSVHLSQLKQRGRVNNNLRKWALASNRETET